MKKFTLLMISLYQCFVSATLRNILGINRMCRFSPTCSEYARIAISKDGAFTGLRKTFFRVLRCQPFSSRFDRD